MRLGLIQVKQNGLYDFGGSEPVSMEGAGCLQQEMLEQNYRLIGEAGRQQCDLIVTTEAINFCGQPKRLEKGWERLVADSQERVLNRLSRLAVQEGSYLVAGMYLVNPKGGMTNSAVVFNPKGEKIGVYDKIHLAGDEKSYLRPGNRPLLFDTPFGRIGVCICWDAQFPETYRLMALEGAHLAVCPTWGWEGIYGHARAYENGIYVASAMSVPYKGGITGMRTPSEVIGPDGSLLFRASKDEAQLLTGVFDPTRMRELWRLRMGDRRPECYGDLVNAVKTDVIHSCL